MPFAAITERRLSSRRLEFGHFLASRSAAGVLPSSAAATFPLQKHSRPRKPLRPRTGALRETHTSAAQEAPDQGCRHFSRKKTQRAKEVEAGCLLSLHFVPLGQGRAAGTGCIAVQNLSASRRELLEDAASSLRWDRLPACRWSLDNFRAESP